MEIREWILRPKIRETEKVYLQWSKQRKKRTGLQALYYSYLYQMGVFQKKPKRIPYEVREDIRRLDQRIAQIEFLQKQDISTLEQLQEFRHPLEEKMAQLLLERGQLYRSQPGCERIGKITEEMKLATAKAIASLVPDEELNENNILPEAFDPRVADVVSEAVKELI